MNKIIVNKQELLEKVRENRDNHKEVFEKALDRYEKAAIKQFKKNIEEIRNGGNVRRSLNIPQPEEHLDDYDTVIGMLEMHTGDEVELEVFEYKNYVQDDWGWSGSFFSNTASYVND